MTRRRMGSWFIALVFGVVLAAGLSQASAQYPPVTGSLVLGAGDATPDLGAEVANLRAWKAGRLGWPEMRRRYLAGLTREPAAGALERLRALARRRRVTLLCSCEDAARCHRSLLAAKLAGRS